jgi:anti-sigma factor RsiW
MKSEPDNQQIHAFVDDELELSRRLEIEQRIEHDPATRREIELLRQLRSAVRDRADYHVAPDPLRSRIAALADPARATSAGSSSPVKGSWRGWRPLSAALALALLSTVGVQFVLSRGDGEDRLRDDLVASHVRATIGGRLVDIASSDHHTVKPWLSSRLDYSPPVRDGDLGGMTFLGGRVDYLDGRPVAALVYRKGGHVVDAFVWPTKGDDRAVGYAGDRGFQIAHWSKAGMTWWAISDVGRSEFGAFVEAIRADDPGR